MAYELSFSEDFFWGPYGTEETCLDDEGRPGSLYQAIDSMPLDEYQALCGLHLIDSDCEDATHQLVEKAKEVNTCSNLDTPVEVWLDEHGEYRVEVY